MLNVNKFRDSVDGFVESRLSGLSGILFEAFLRSGESRLHLRGFGWDSS